jgi:hypothetical protein
MVNQRYVASHMELVKSAALRALVNILHVNKD